MAAGPPTAPTSVAFHFDIMCPYAYQTSIWMRTVRDALDLDVAWRFFSLEDINREEGKKHPWERPWSYGWSMMRIGALLRRMDMDLLDRWYLAAGTALHVDGRKPHRPEVAEALLAELGLDPAYVQQAIDDPTTLFGPVLIEPPTGDAAVRLWHLMTGWLEFPNVYEVQRPKRHEDIAAIARAFQPYLEARDWISIQKETP